MGTVWIIISCVLWALSLYCMYRNQLLAPALSYLGLLGLSMADGPDGVPLLPLNNSILIGWLCMTLVVMVATLLQPAEIRAQTRGTLYMAGGALTGMALGLLAFSATESLPMRYGVMVVATAVGLFFGFLLFTNTPSGQRVGLRTGNSFRYLLAKGFPIAVAAMMMGIVLVILVAMRPSTAL